MINAAIVRLGRWGQTLVDAVHGKSDEIRFTRGVTRTVANAFAFAEAKGIALDDDYMAMLADPAIDAVVLATPHTLHCEQICAAAEAGINTINAKITVATTLNSFIRINP